MSANVISAANMHKHLQHLCERIGTRLAGTKAEAKGAEYIAGQYRKLGLKTEIQEFPCITWTCKQADFAAQLDGRWQDVPIQANTQSPSTEGELDTELVYLETAQVEDTEGKDLRGKVGLLFGSAYASVERMERLCNSGLAALLYVDDRFPFCWRLASGLIAGWIDLLTIPTATIPYMHAWDLVRQGVKRVRLSLQMDNFRSHSQNVVASLPGKRSLPPLVLGGHHDSVALGVGAEDDGTGVVAVLEIARLMRDREPLRPIQFVSFGWEENLSEGARNYVIHPANDAANTAFMFNFDSLGSWLGNNQAHCTGDRAVRKFVSEYYRRRRYVAEVTGDVSPFSDHFAFNMLGVPSVWFHRINFPGSRFYHHSEYDQIGVINFDQLAETTQAAADMVIALAQRPDLPFPSAIPAAQQRIIARHRRDLYDCICDWQQPGLMRPVGKPWREDIR
ncbi:M28 family peptidase [bacterium]|nr:M28 family peptidase [bacterium]